jgi:hypothetical protein
MASEASFKLICFNPMRQSLLDSYFGIPEMQGHPVALYNSLFESIQETTRRSLNIGGRVMRFPNLY